MGLLDDAIREHLELKRRRGADPSEIEREEVEALGPVRRGDVELDDGPEGGPIAGDEPAGLEDPGAAYAEEPPAAAAPAPPANQPVPAEPPQTHDAPFAEDERDSATPPHGDPWVQQPTREFSSDEVEEALSDHRAEPPDPDVVPADAESDDVLEETPDFLQETPEHDRLWFEQKPPKDFDF